MSRALEHLVVLDFEATCDTNGAPQPQEVIEFPSVLVSLRERAVVDAFESFVRPTHHPVLTPFCTELTGITQSEVDAAAAFPEVVVAHQAWLASHGLLERPDTFALLTCGDWDLRTMLPAQCAASGPPITDLPRAYRRWINVKHVFGAAFGRRKAGGMPHMLADLDLELIGRHHRGIDDCRNIARIALALAERGVAFALTGSLPASRYPDLPLTLVRGDVEHDLVLTKRALASLLGRASALFRTEVQAVETADGVEVDEERLRELRAGARLRVVLRPALR